MTEIRSSIDRGAYKPGDTLPSDTVLRAEKGLSNATIRQALHELVLEGYIARHVGKGTVVLPRNTSADAVTIALQDDSSTTAAVPFQQDLFTKCGALLSVKKLKTNIRYSIIPGSSDKNEYVTSDICDSHTLFNKSVLPGEYAKVLNQDLTGSGISVFHTFNEKTFDFFSVNGLLYRLPVYFFPLVLIYNPAVFDLLQVPYPDESLDWESFLHLNQTIIEKSVKDRKNIYALYMDPNLNRLYPFVRQNGGEFFSENKQRCTCASKKTVDAINYFRKLISINPVIPRVMNIQANHYACGLFAYNNLAMMIGQAFDIDRLRRNGAKFSVTELPHGTQKSTMIFTRAYAVNKNSASHAGIFLSQMFSDSIQQYIHDETVYMAADKTIMQTPSLSFQTLKKVYLNSFQYGQLYDENWHLGFSELLSQSLTNVLLEKEETEHALMKAENEINSTLQSKKFIFKKADHE